MRIAVVGEARGARPSPATWPRAGTTSTCSPATRTMRPRSRRRGRTGTCRACGSPNGCGSARFATASRPTPGWSCWPCRRARSARWERSTRPGTADVPVADQGPRSGHRPAAVRGRGRAARRRGAGGGRLLGAEPRRGDRPRHAGGELFVASQPVGLAQRLQETMATSRLRVYANADVVGVELCGAAKNVIALAAGVSDAHAKAALITRGLAEMLLGASFDADPRTFAGLAGLGDLVATCCSLHSRNPAGRACCWPRGSRDRLDRRLALQQRVDALRDGQFQAALGRDALQHRGGRDALRNHADRRLEVVRRDPLGQQHARPAVSRVQAAAGGDQIAEAGQPGEGARIGVEGRAEPRHLGQAARDQRRLGVVTEAEAVRDALSEGDHVLRGAAQLDPDHVGVRIDPQARRRDRLLQPLREADRLRCDDGRRRRAAGDLLGVVRPRQHRHPPRVAEQPGRDLGQPPAGGRIEALGQRQDVGLCQARRALPAPLRTRATARPARPARRRARRRREAGRPAARRRSARPAGTAGSPAPPRSRPHGPRRGRAGRRRARARPGGWRRPCPTSLRRRLQCAPADSSRAALAAGHLEAVLRVGDVALGACPLEAASSPPRASARRACAASRSARA